MIQLVINHKGNTMNADNLVEKIESGEFTKSEIEQLLQELKKTQEEYLNLQNVYQKLDLNLTGVFAQLPFMAWVFDNDETVFAVTENAKEHTGNVNQLIEDGEEVLKTGDHLYKLEQREYEGKKIIFAIRQFKIEPLNVKNLAQAKALQNEIFNDLNKSEKLLLEASLDMHRYKNLLLENEIETLEYWVLKDCALDKVAGIVGLYKEIGSSSIVWLGWFGVDASYRKKSLGEKLLEFAISKSEAMDMKQLHLYSWDSKFYQPAIRLYEKYGFIAYTPDEKTDKKDIFMKKDLTR
ncbi:MAG: GNAT family N-acetyltransferase [Thermotogota bacterium]